MAFFIINYCQIARSREKAHLVEVKIKLSSNWEGRSTEKCHHLSHGGGMGSKMGKIVSRKI
jgi:hypothetical protein